MNLTTIDIVTPIDKIEFFSAKNIVDKQDYKKEIFKIENMLYYNVAVNSNSKDIYTYIVIESNDGHKEVIIHSDFQMIHIYDNRVIKTCKIPYVTYLYSKKEYWD